MNNYAGWCKLMDMLKVPPEAWCEGEDGTIVVRKEAWQEEIMDAVRVYCALTGESMCVQIGGR